MEIIWLAKFPDGKILSEPTPNFGYYQDILSGKIIHYDNQIGFIDLFTNEFEEIPTGVYKLVRLRSEVIDLIQKFSLRPKFKISYFELENKTGTFFTIYNYKPVIIVKSPYSPMLISYVLIYNWHYPTFASFFPYNHIIELVEITETEKNFLLLRL